MDVLIADEDPIYRRLVARHLANWGYESLIACDGAEAWEFIRTGTRAMLAILDWSMPKLDGPEICGRIRSLPADRMVHAILLTGRTARTDIITGLRAGADDYLTKPFDPEELYARIQTGIRLLRLQQTLADRVRELAEALTSVRHLQGLLPMCSYCKCIRDDQNYWRQVEHYIAARSDAVFSHGICPSCYQKVVEPQLEEIRRCNSPMPEVTGAGL
jgi:sigma-B regulation protein RsbU (phosphoserine phosphatase)